MQVIGEPSRLFDIRAQYWHQNSHPPEEFLVDIDLLGQEILAQFELIEFILNSIITAQFMANFKAKKSKVMPIFLSFFGIPDLKLIAVLFTVFLIELLSEHSKP